jgi:gas vesicle protein
MDTKICKTCGKEKPLSEYGVMKGTKDGLNYTCKECCNERARAYRKANSDKVRASVNKWQAANRERTNEITREWMKNNPEKVKANSKRHYEANKEKIRTRVREWYEKNKKNKK